MAAPSGDDQASGTADSPVQYRPHRVRLTIGAGIVLVLLGLAVAVLVAAVAPRGSTETIAEPNSVGSSPNLSATAEPNAAPAGTLFVHILGEVAKPGLYQLRAGDRAIDAVAAAGGLTDAADDAQLNLARFLTDGEQIIVPKVGDVPAPVAGGAVSGPASKVNINSADAAALEDLPGVGPALAQRIIDWRAAQGPFAAIDDLKNVTGIGDKVFAGFQENITT